MTALELNQKKIFSLSLGSSIDSNGQLLAFSPPWSRKQVHWIGDSIAVLRIAVEDSSRWLLGAGFAWSEVFPHERTFKRVAQEKGRIFEQLKINPWPSHLACAVDPDEWRQDLSELVRRQSPFFDSGHQTLWFISAKDFFSHPIIQTKNILSAKPSIVLDGHHSRMAQKQKGFSNLFGWIEPLHSPHLKVASIDRAGFCKQWINEMISDGYFKRVEKKLISSISTQNLSPLVFEVIQVEDRFFCEITKKAIDKMKKSVWSDSKHIALDIVSYLVNSRLGSVFPRFTTSPHLSHLEELLGGFEADTILRFVQPEKSYIYERATSRMLFPQKATYFHPKIPFGLLIADLKS